MNRRLEKSNAVKDKNAAWQWAQEHDACACCWRYAGMIGVWLETHHIIKQGRSDEPCNFLRLCKRCHDLAEMHKVPVEYDMQSGLFYPKLSLGVCLTLKKESDIENWKPERLTELRHSNLPEPEPVPDIFLLERSRLGLGNFNPDAWS